MFTLREYPGSVRLFKNDFLEYFSHIHPATPIVVYGPVVTLFSWWGIHNQSPLAFVGLFLLGVLLWTFLEYTLHRFAFHYEPKSPMGKRLHFLLHGVHHDYPNDGTRLVMPLLFSAPLAVVVFFTFKVIFGEQYYGAFAGIVTGYIAYDCIHYATHHFKMQNPVAKFLKVYHLKHHFQDPNTGYGVSSPLWDYIVGTVPEKVK